uniref:Uncharacterized protein n=1 Tax=Cacopsylla melanoneura TaxID=428564 RepID=A0A8D9A7T5_9HEMI
MIDWNEMSQQSQMTECLQVRDVCKVGNHCQTGLFLTSADRRGCKATLVQDIPSCPAVVGKKPPSSSRLGLDNEGRRPSVPSNGESSGSSSPSANSANNILPLYEGLQ